MWQNYSIYFILPNKIRKICIKYYFSFVIYSVIYKFPQKTTRGGWWWWWKLITMVIGIV